MNYGSFFALFIFLTVILPKLNQAVVLAKAKLEECANDGSEKLQCTSRGVIVTLALYNEQNRTETLQAEVKALKDPATGEVVKIAKPFRVVLEKSRVTIHYPIFGLGKIVNSRPYEEQIKTGKCYAEWKRSTATCGFRTFKKTGKEILYSQGFCCKCGWSKVHGSKKGHENRNKGLSCGIWMTKRSAMCMRYDQLWYQVYEVTAPRIDFSITVKILNQGRSIIYKGVATPTWVLNNTFTLSPSERVWATKDGRLRAKWIGDLEIPQRLHDLSQKYLLIPDKRDYGDEPYEDEDYSSSNHKDNIVKAGSKEWLFINKHRFEFSGATCDRIGASFEAFNFQPNRCFEKKNSCLRNQPYHYWKADQVRVKKGKATKQYPGSFGPFLSEEAKEDTLKIKYLLEGTHFSILHLWLDANDVILIYNWAPGKIVEAYVSDFEAHSKDGKLSATVKNTGRVISDFTLTIGECTRAIGTVPAQTFSVGPGEIAERHFKIFGYDYKGTASSCKVTLRSPKTGNIFDTKTVSFKTTTTCFDLGVCGNVCDVNSTLSCIQSPPKSGNNENAFLGLLRKNQVYIYLVIGAIGLVVGVKVCAAVKQYRAGKKEKKEKEKKKTELTETVDEEGNVIKVENVEQTKKMRRVLLILFAIAFLPLLPCVWFVRRWVQISKAKAKQEQAQLEDLRLQVERELNLDFQVKRSESLEDGRDISEGDISEGDSYTAL